MFPRSDFRLDTPDALLMSDFGSLTDFHDLAKDMFVSNAMVNMADGGLLEELDCKDDMKPLFTTDVNDAFDLPLTDCDDAYELPLRVPHVDDVDILDSAKVQSNLLSMLLEEKPSESPEEKPSQSPNKFMALTPLPTCSDSLDLTPPYSGNDGLPASVPHGAASSSSPINRSESAPSLASPSHSMNKTGSRRGARSLSSIDTISPSALQINSPLSSPSATSAFNSSGGGSLFSIFYTKDNASTKESPLKDLSPRVDDFATSIRGTMGGLHAGQEQAYQIPSIQRSQSSHALGQFGMIGSLGCRKDDFNVSTVCDPERAISTSNPSFSHWAPCHPKAMNTMPSLTPMRRVFSTGDLQDLNGIQSSYGGNMENANRHGVGGKIGHCTLQERKMKLHRYRQKRTERNFRKKIQYACRKTLADSRPRVRGRFARSDETETGDLPLIDEYEEVSNHGPKIIPEAAYLIRDNSVIMATNQMPQYWNAVGMKVAI